MFSAKTINFPNGDGKLCRPLLYTNSESYVKVWLKRLDLLDVNLRLVYLFLHHYSSQVLSDEDRRVMDSWAKAFLQLFEHFQFVELGQLLLKRVVFVRWR